MTTRPPPTASLTSNPGSSETHLPACGVFGSPRLAIFTPSNTTKRSLPSPSMLHSLMLLPSCGAGTDKRGNDKGEAAQSERLQQKSARVADSIAFAVCMRPRVGLNTRGNESHDAACGGQSEHC